MAAIDLKQLVGHLNDTCRRTLEAAAGLTLSRTHYNVEIEHWLVRLSERPDSDISVILKHYEIEAGRFATDLNRSLEKMKTGNGRAPSLAPEIVELVKQAWLFASLEQNAYKVRSGHLLWALLADETLAQHARDASSQLLKIAPDLLKRDFVAITGNSAEAQEAGAAAAAAAEGGAAGEGGPPMPRGGGGALDQFTTDLTAQAKAGKIDPILGRDTEIRQMIDILTRRRQNNPILTGEAGVGKTAVVEGFALRLAVRRRAAGLAGRHAAHTRSWPAAGRRGGEGRVRKSSARRHRRGEGQPQADHPVHRRGAPVDRRRRLAGPGRCRQPVEAGAGARRVAHHRGDHLGGIQEILREGRGPDPPLPGREGRGTHRAGRHRDDPRPGRHAGEAPQRAHPGPGGQRGGASVGALHSVASVAGQGGQPDRHRLRARGDEPGGGARADRGPDAPHRPDRHRTRHRRPRDRRR